MEAPVSTRDILSILFRQKAKIIVFFISTMVFVMAGVYAWPESYEASAILLVKLGRENVSVPSVLPSSQQVLTWGITKEQVNSEIEILRSMYLTEETVKELGTEFFFPESDKPTTRWKLIKYHVRKALMEVRDFCYEILYKLDIFKRLTPYEDAVSAIQKKLDVTAIKNSNTISVEFSWSNPVIAAEIVNALIRRYMDYRTVLYKTPGALELFETQSTDFKGKLTNSEDKLQNFRKRWAIISLETQKTAVVQRISELKKNLQETEGEIRKTQKEIDELTSQISETVPGIGGVNSENEQGEFLQNSKTTKDTVSRLVKPTFPVISTELETRILDAKVRLAAQKEKGKSLLEHLERYNSEFEKLGEKEIGLLRLQRDSDILDENYRLYIKKLEETRISSVMDSAKIANVSVVSYASAPFEPIRPRKLLILICGFVVALFGGAALAFTWEYLDHSIQNPEDVERYLKLPVLASVRKVRQSYRRIK